MVKGNPYIKKCRLIRIKFLLALSCFHLFANSQQVLNGSLENYLTYSLNRCDFNQDTILFNTHIRDVNMYVEHVNLNSSIIFSYARYHWFVDTSCYIFNAARLNRLTPNLHGKAFLDFNRVAIADFCNNMLTILSYYPKFNFKLSDAMQKNKNYLIRFSTDMYSPQQEIYFGYSTINGTHARPYFAKTVKSGVWRKHAFSYIPDSNYRYITVGLENRPMPNCYGDLPEGLFDNLILDTCVHVGIKQTVSVSPCQKDFPVSLQSSRTAGSMYFWSNDDTLPATVVNDTGVYVSFVYDSIGCAIIDSFIVQYDSTLVAGSSKEILLCSNASVTLTADSIAIWYQWNTGATTRTINVSDTGVYWIKSKTGNCIRIDTFVVKHIYVPPLFAPHHRSLCALQTATIHAYHPHYNRYLWSTGDTTSVIYVNQTGRYYVTASDSICSITDSVDVLILNQVGETKDTGICVSGNIVLQSRPANTYLWSTGDTTSTLNVWKGGVYTVTRTIQQCQLTDTFVVVNYPTPITTTSDTSICYGTKTVLNAQSASHYLWSTGDTAQSIQVINAGQYSVITSIPPCQGTQTFNVSAYPLPQIVTVQDTTVCFDEVKQILLDAGQFSKYLWEPTGETTRTIYSNTAQVYKLTVTDSNTCVSSKDFAVMEECPYSLYIPNAFTPNSDGTNDVLVIKGNRIDSFRMMVINRWGQIVFETTRMDDYWTAQGCTNDVYTLIIEYSTLGKTKNYKGSVTVLR